MRTTGHTVLIAAEAPASAGVWPRPCVATAAESSSAGDAGRRWTLSWPGTPACDR